MSDFAKYCEICGTFHPPRSRDRCQRDVRRLAQRPRSFGALWIALVLGVGVGWVAGSVTNDGAMALGTAGGTVVAVMLFSWIRSRSP